MPSSILINGQRRYQPGVYTTIDASDLGGQTPSTGRAVVVGDFPWLEQNVPTNFSSNRALSGLVPDVREALDVGKCAFAPSTQTGIGGVDVLGFCNAQPNTQAAYTLENGAATVDELTLKAKVWGSLGNRTKVKIVSDGDGGAAWTLSRGAKVERYNIPSPVLAEITYDGSDFTGALAAIGSTVWGVAWLKACAFLAPGGAQSRAFNLTEGRSDNRALTVSLTNGGSGVSTQNVTVTFTGLDHLGAAATETLTAAAGGTTWAPSNTTTTLWSRVDRIVIATNDAAYNGTVSVTGYAFYLSPSAYENVGQMIAALNSAANLGFHCNTVTPGASSIPARILSGKAGGGDHQSLTSCLSPAKVEVKSTVWHIERALAGSLLVETEVPSASDGAVYPYGEAADTTLEQFLVGGSESASDADDFVEALRQTEARNYQLVLGWKTDLASMQALITHCQAAAVQGYERAAFAGAPAGQTLAVLFSDFAALCNSPYLQITGQSVEFAGSDGLIRTYEPKYLAALALGMRAGTPVATPLTNKRPAVTDYSQTWDAALDTNEAISYGLLVLSSDLLGPRFARDVTTYLEDANPAYSAGSAWESCQASVRDLRGFLAGQIGNPSTASTTGKIAGIARSRLNEQVKSGIIKAWNTLLITDGGDQYDVSYNLAPVEGVNFILVTANVVRIPST